MKHIVLFTLAMLFAGILRASPGAHGPNGEHLDHSPAESDHAEATPRFESFTENFELVGKLNSAGLSVVVDEYKTNVPVVNAAVELEVNGIKATGKFHEDTNDYAFDDPKILEQIKKPGEHELVFTINTATDSDLIPASLYVGSKNAEHTHGHGEAAEHHHNHGSHLDEWLHSPLVWALVVGVLLGVFLVLRRLRIFGNN